MNEKMATSQDLLEALSRRALHITPIRGRFLLSLKCCLDEARQTDMKRLAAKRVTVGNTLACLGLWEDASHQWQRATQLDPLSSDARNNLAVAYELKGESALANSEYERALALEPHNVYIRDNYELCRQGPAPDRTHEGREQKQGPVVCH